MKTKERLMLWPSAAWVLTGMILGQFVSSPVQARSPRTSELQAQDYLQDDTFKTVRYERVDSW